METNRKTGPLRSFGRKHGKRLSKRRQALLDEALPRLAVPLDDEPGGGALDPAQLFARPVTSVWLELGFGAGEHVAEQAQRHPGTGIIACEPFVNGVASLLAQVDARGLDNVRIHMGDGRDVIDALADASLDRVYILHPDPWPKKRHWKRRLFSAATLDALARVMRPGALLRFASDHGGYVAFALEAGTRHAAFAWTADGPDDWRGRPGDWVQTRYEEKARAQGLVPWLLEFRRV